MDCFRVPSPHDTWPQGPWLSAANHHGFCAKQLRHAETHEGRQAAEVAQHLHW